MKGSMNLLIVDDHPTNLKLLRAQLESEGHTVFEARDGVDALALLNRQRVDVVISDILMPRMDGYRLCYEIRKHARLHDLPVILCTSTYTSPGDEKLVLDVGADKYLKRPVSLETLVAALHEVIAMPHAAPQPKALQEVEVLKEYSERLVSKLEEKNTELQAAEVKFRALVEQSIVGICIIQDDQFVYVNPRMAGIFGWSEEEMTARTLSEFIVPEDQALARDNIRQRISGEVPSIHYSLRMLHQSGAVLEVEVHGSRTEYNGRPAVMGTLMDITERKRTEEVVQQSLARLQSLSSRLLDIQETERRQLARELHDEIGQALTAAKINLQSLQRYPDPTAVAPRLADSVRIVERALQQVRSLSLSLRPPLLDDLGLAAALRWLVDESAHRTGMRVELRNDVSESRFDAATEIACFRIVQEALNNVAKHSGARNIVVELQVQHEDLHARVLDDGAGFAVAIARRRAVGGASLGLLGMEERATLAGGDIEWTSGPGRGTEVHAWFPLNWTADTGRDGVALA